MSNQDRAEGVLLLPCPFCGNTSMDDDEGCFQSGKYWEVRCGNPSCFAHECARPTHAEAIAAWNTRTAAPQAPGADTPGGSDGWVEDAQSIGFVNAVGAVVWRPEYTPEPGTELFDRPVPAESSGGDAVGEMLSGNAYLNVAGLCLPDGTKLYAEPNSAQDGAKNAERYLWLRDQYWASSNIFVVEGGKSVVKLGSDCPRTERLDAVIDAAIASGGECGRGSNVEMG